MKKITKHLLEFISAFLLLLLIIWLVLTQPIGFSDNKVTTPTAYHTPQDTADRLNYQKMAQVVEASYYTVLQQLKTIK